MWNVILSIRDALKDKNELPRVINLSKNGKDIVTLHEDHTAGASLTIWVNNSACQLKVRSLWNEVPIP